MESSRRDLSNDIAEHRPNLTNNQNTNYPRFNFTLETGIEFPKTGVSLSLIFFLRCLNFHVYERLVAAMIKS